MQEELHVGMWGHSAVMLGWDFRRLTEIPGRDASNRWDTWYVLTLNIPLLGLLGGQVNQALAHLATVFFFCFLIRGLSAPLPQNWEGGLPSCLSEGTLGHWSQGTWFKEALAFNRHCDKPLRGNKLTATTASLYRFPLLMFLYLHWPSYSSSGLTKHLLMFFQSQEIDLMLTMSLSEALGLILTECNCLLRIDVRNHTLRVCIIVLCFESSLCFSGIKAGQPCLVLSCLVLLGASANSSSLCQTCCDITYKKALWWSPDPIQ